MRNKLFYLLSILLVLSCSRAFAAQELDEMVAVVNDDVITTSELEQAITVTKTQIANERMNVPSDTVLKKQVLDQLINKKLQLQLAKQAGMDVSDDELNKAITTVAQQNNMTVSNLYQRIKDEGLSTEEYRSELHDQLLLQKLQRQEVASKITISPQEVTTFMSSQVWQNNSSNEYRLKDILVPVADSPTPDALDAAKKRALAIMSKLKSGTSFQSVAQAESANKNALQGGDLGWRQLPEIPSAFTTEVSRMHKNDVAGPIQTPNGFHVIHLTDVRALSQDKQKLNRKAIENLLMQQKFEEAMVNWVSKLRSEAFVNLHPQKQLS